MHFVTEDLTAEEGIVGLCIEGPVQGDSNQKA